MQWWAWVVGGAILLGSELAFVDAQFYLVFVGGAALVVGLSQLAGAGLAMGSQWLMFAVLAAISMVSFRRRIYERMRRGLPQMAGGPVGETVVVPAELAPGANCRLEFRGSSWSAVNGGRQPIAAGAKARIRRVEGLTLIVHAGD
jgi:membrane protein implicated in regulation of membrane protease activity